MLFTHVLAPDCIATLLEFSGSGMPVSVLLKDHDYFVTCLSIVNLQMRREEMKKNKPKQIHEKIELQICKWMCMTQISAK